MHSDQEYRAAKIQDQMRPAPISDLKEKIAQVRVAIKRIEGFEKVGCDIAYSRLGAMHENLSAILDALEAAQRENDRLRAELAIYKPTESTENGGTK